MAWVDRAQNPPEEYRASWNNFASLNLVRSDPAITVDVMFRMVTDGNARKVHYYSGPDGEAIPRVKQLLGQDWYLEVLGAEKPRRIHPALDGVDATPPPRRWAVTAVPNRVNPLAKLANTATRADRARGDPS